MPKRGVGVVTRFVVTPAREFVLALEELRSPEMREAREMKLIPDLRRLGKFKFVIKQTAKLTGMMTGVAIVLYAGSAIAGTHGGIAKLGFVGSVLMIAAVSVAVGLPVFTRIAWRLARDYPEPGDQ